MSNEKLKTFFERTKKFKSVINENIEFDISKYLITEEKIHSQDIKDIISFIEKPKKGSFQLKSYSKNYSKDERDVNVNYKGSEIEFIFNNDFDELTIEIIDYCDENGFKFTFGSDKKNELSWVKVKVK